MTTHKDLIDEKPRFKWSDYEPAKSLNEQKPTKFSVREIAILACGGIGLFLVVFALLVGAFCW